MMARRGWLEREFMVAEIEAQERREMARRVAVRIARLEGGLDDEPAVDAAAIKVGDVVTVLQLVQFGGARKIPARVVAIRGGSFGVEALFGAAFDDDGHTQLWLQTSMKGRTWE